MAFKNALNKPALAVVRDAPRAPTPPSTPQPPSAPTVHPSRLVKKIERAIGKNRIDVYFTEKPPVEVLTTMKANKFWYNGTDKFWYNKDSAEAREFLKDYLGADIDGLPPPEDKDDAVLPNQTNGNGTGSPAVRPIGPTPMLDVGLGDYTPLMAAPEQGKPSYDGEPLATYRRQCDELLVKLQIHAGDLLLVAIAALHKQHFPD